MTYCSMTFFRHTILPVCHEILWVIVILLCFFKRIWRMWLNSYYALTFLACCRRTVLWNYLIFSYYSKTYWHFMTLYFLFLQTIIFFSQFILYTVLTYMKYFWENFGILYYDFYLMNVFLTYCSLTD